MEWKTFFFRKLGFYTLVSGLGLSVCHSAYTLDLPNAPLLLEASIEPNVMLLIDDSGSMTGGFNFGSYNPSIDYASCPSGLSITGFEEEAEGGDLIIARVNDDGYVFFDVPNSGGSYDSYAWGTSSGTDANTGLEHRCFATDGNYYVRYSADFDNLSNNNDDFAELLRGNFWNFYFSNDDRTDGDRFGFGVEGEEEAWFVEDQKFGIGERIEIAQDAAKRLVVGLDGVRFGLAGFDNDQGGRVLVGLNSLDSEIDATRTHRDLLVEQINAIFASGFTPLAESLLELGRYFVEGTTDQNLVLHPDNLTGTEEVISASDVLYFEPSYRVASDRPSSVGDSAIQAYCQQNSVVLLTDGFPTRDNKIPGSEDYNVETEGFGNFLLEPTLPSTPNIAHYDANLSETFRTNYQNAIANYKAATLDSEEQDFPNTYTSISGNNANLDDVALMLNEIDLRPDLNEIDGDEVVNNISTYLVAGFGLNPNTVIQNTANNGVGVGLDDSASAGTIYQADDGDQLVTAFNDIFEEIFSTAASLSSVTFNSGAIESDTALYQATFSRAEFLWNGDLRAFPFDDGTGFFSEVASWSAADKLDNLVAGSTHEGRLIITTGASGEGIAFTTANWAALSELQRNDLMGDGDSTLGQSVLNYIRGESNPLFRDRREADGTPGILGDIVNSSPIEVGEPEVEYPDYGTELADGSISEFGAPGALYSDFASDYENRTSMVYVGANDGMLHAFYGDPATGGDEAFAYIPSMVFDDSSTLRGLHYLTDTQYGHRFYVDGALTASDVFINPGVGSRSWRTILVGGLRAGGRGVFALDVTDPTDFTDSSSDIANLVLWEFDGNDDEDMGHVYGNARVAKMSNGQWAVIVGNGYNSGSGEAKIFVIFIEEGVDGAWEAGDWIELSTGVSGDNGMGPPVIADLDGDFIADRIYAGDLKGNLWAFDVTDSNEDNWQSAYSAGGSPEPLLVATDTSGTPQPITTQPLLTFNPDTPRVGNEPNVLVFFGTGKFIEISDFTDNSPQAFYAVWDRGDSALTRTDLTSRTLMNTTITNAEGENVTLRTVDGDDLTWWNGSTGSYGWRMTFPVDGERTIVEPAILRGALFFASSLPSTSSCSNGGQGFVNSVSTNGLTTHVPFFDADDDGDIDADDLGYVGEAVLDGLPSGAAYIGNGDGFSGGGGGECPENNGQIQVYSTSSGELEYRLVCPPGPDAIGRMSWQELLVQ